MNTLSVSLKQHSPLIHFQCFEPGATLRATELKPKLDRFLHAKLNNSELNTSVLNTSWYNNFDKKSLNYKISIKYNGGFDYYLPFGFLSRNNSQVLEDKLKQYNNTIKILSNTPFFANMDKQHVSEMSFANLAKEEIALTFSSYHAELITQITKHLAEFFLHENFGTRQNKGFGSFTVSSINNKKISECNGKSIFFAKSAYDHNNINSALRFINEQHQILKSGKNFRNYIKSRLCVYFKKENISWEKAFFKNKINANRINNKELYHTWQHQIAYRENDQYKLIRPLLGLSDKYEFLTTFYNNKGEKRIDRRHKYIVTINNGEIQRYKSPLFYKIINNKVYIKANVNSDIMNKSFEVKVKLEGNGMDSINYLGTLTTPDSFDISDFLKKGLNNNQWELIE